MSHESSTWSVEQNREREERARKDAWRQVKECQSEVSELEKSLAAAKRKHGNALTGLHCERPQQPAEDAQLAQIKAFLNALKSYLSTTRSQLSGSVAALETGARLAGLVPIKSRVTASRTPDPIQIRGETITRILGRVPGNLARKQHQRVAELAERLMQESDSNRASNLELELRAHAQNLRELALQAENERATAAEWRAKLFGLEGSDVTAVDAELALVERGDKPLLPPLLKRLAEVEKQARQAADRRYATQVIQQAFESLGYVVEEGFDTAFVEGGVVHLQHPEMNEYAVELEVEPAHSRFHAHPVREAVSELDPDGKAGFRQQRDIEHEAKLCGHLREVRKAMKAHGVHGQLDARKAPGQAGAVKVVERQARKRRKRTAQEQTAPNRR